MNRVLARKNDTLSIANPQERRGGKIGARWLRKSGGHASKEMRGNGGSTWYRHGINLPSTRVYAERGVLLPQWHHPRGRSVRPRRFNEILVSRHIFRLSGVLSKNSMIFRARKEDERSEVGEVWGFLRSNVESRTEAGSCIRIIFCSFGTFVILPAKDSCCLLKRTIELMTVDLECKACESFLDNKDIDITHKGSTIAVATVREEYIGLKKRQRPKKSKNEASLQTRIDLVHNSSVGECSPVTASLSHDIWDLHLVGDIRRVDHQVDVHTLADVPSNVTVEGPDTPVVKLDLDDEVAVGLNELGVAALRV